MSGIQIWCPLPWEVSTEPTCGLTATARHMLTRSSTPWRRAKDGRREKKNSLSKSIQIHEPGGQRLELVTFGFMNYSIHHCSPDTSHQTWPEYARTICRFGPPEALSPQVFAAFSHRWTVKRIWTAARACYCPEQKGQWTRSFHTRALLSWESSEQKKTIQILYILRRIFNNMQRSLRYLRTHIIVRLKMSWNRAFLPLTMMTMPLCLYKINERTWNYLSYFCHPCSPCPHHHESSWKSATIYALVKYKRASRLS